MEPCRICGKDMSGQTTVFASNIDGSLLHSTKCCKNYLLLKRIYHLSVDDVFERVSTKSIGIREDKKK